MCNYEKEKEQKRKDWNKKKAEDVNKSKGFVFNPKAVVSKKEGIKIYLELMRDHARTINQKVPVNLDGKRFLIHPDGKVYRMYPKGKVFKQIDLNDF